ncbi:5-formyltetrahydrofolate cyclo-ligase [Ferruginibacter paludis]|uniref:5-formyltetrahydrofolate cyclo-ligase n=1 Tax=Ferruginibacter paludis TaxID=1310417 RepID=UPI0025B40FB7|nr:5-formyltetrahydrofolate cyclo-ligase [Ferruginibacter paludis]MDN3657592.1 5-formyltetrahydrofolate cyclo-ligase [Ferruginibacter paludis]
MYKSEIRNLYKTKRQQLSFSEREKMSDLMLIHFQRLPIDIPTIILTYSPFQKMSEFDPQLITDYCFFKNRDMKLLYPVMMNDQNQCEMQAVLVDDDSYFETNKYGIDEPVGCTAVPASEIELSIIPLISFDKTGNRVGYGKGYYDRFLNKCSPKSIKIGFSYFDAIDVIDDVNPYDIRLDYCITPERIFTF